MDDFGQKLGNSRIIVLTLLAALFLNVMPYPEWAKYARPDWVTLVLFYWCLATPNRVGVGVGWLMGLLLDIMQYSLFGVQAIGKAFVALLAVSAHRRLRLYHPGQQCAVVFLIAALDIGIVAWIHHLAGDAAIRPHYWQGAIATALLWPPLSVLLRMLRRRSGVVRR